MIWGKKGVSLPYHMPMLWFSLHLPIWLGQGNHPPVGVPRNRAEEGRNKKEPM